MMMRTRLGVLAALALIGTAAPALAQDAPAVPADTNKALWCATAFTLVEPQARAQGQTDAADRFKKYSDSLIATSHDGLAKAGFTEDQIKTQTDAYTDKVGKELGGGGQPEFTVVDCTALVDPEGAAAMQAGAAAAPAAPNTTPAPNTETPAPAAPATPDTTAPVK